MIAVMMKYVTRVLLMAASSSVVLAITPHRIINLGTLPEDDRSSAYGISADGTTVVGWSSASGGGRTFRWTDTDGMTVTGINSITGNYPPAISFDGSVIIDQSTQGAGRAYAFRWTEAGAVNLGALGGTYSRAIGISEDGSVIVGVSIVATGSMHSFCWTLEDGMMTDLGTLGGDYTGALNVSADGSVVVGSSHDASGKKRAFRWTKVEGIKDLGTLGGLESNAHAASENGAVIIGASSVGAGKDFSNGNIHAFRWTRVDNVMQNLGDLGGNYSSALFISRDGSVVAGRAKLADGNLRAFRWTEADGIMKNLGTLGGDSSEATGLSADGKVVVGKSTLADGNLRAFRWAQTEDRMENLGDLGGNHSVATGVSADGRVVVGISKISSGQDRAFIYYDSVMLDAEDWLGSVNGVHSLVSASLELTRAHVEGAHHRPLAELGRGRSFWSTGDIASSSRSRDVLTRSAEAGVTFVPKDNVLIGIGAGYGLQDQGLLNDGSARTFGQYLVGEIDLIQANGGIFSLLASFGDWRNTTDRGYVTGSGVDYSHGETSLASKAFRVRYDSPVLARVYATDLKAYVSYGHSKVRSDAFAEIGGTYPGSFEAMEQTAKEGRLGLAASHALGAKTTVRLSAEWIRRYDHDQAALTATDVTSTISYSLGTPDPVRDQARVGLDVDHKLDDKTTLTFTVHAAGVGESADVSGAISIRRAY